MLPAARVISSAILFFLLCHPAFSQLSERQKQESRRYLNRHFQVDFWDVDNSMLRQGTVKAIAQSPDGLLWIATQDGLARFDGVEFRVYDSRSVPEFRNNFITDVKVASDSTVWCTTLGEGIFGLKDGIARPISAENRLPSAWKSSIMYASGRNNLVTTRQWGVWFQNDSGIGQILDTLVVVNREFDGASIQLFGEYAGALWAATNEGLLRFKGREWEYVGDGKTWQGLPNDVYVEPSGRLWIGSEDGLYFGFENQVKRHEKLHANIRTLNVDRRGRAWASTFEEGLYCLDGENLVHYDEKDGLATNNIRWTFEDSRGFIWVCDQAGGLSVITADGAFFPQADEYLFGSKLVETMYEDREGNLWIGTFAGLARIKERRIQIIATEAGMQSPQVWTIAEGRQGEVFLGTDMGLASMRGDAVKQISAIPSLPITALSLDSEGILWVGTMGDGLWSIEGDEVRKRFPAKGILAPRLIRSADRVGRDSLLIGTKAATILLDVRRTVARVLWADSSGGQLLTTHRDNEDRLWMGMETGLVMEYRPTGNGTRHVLPVDPIRYPISGITSDSVGTLYCSTLGGGIIRISDGESRAFQLNSVDLPSFKFNWIVDDGNGRFWIGTNKGILSVPLTAMTDSAWMPSDLWVFDKTDGLVSMETIAWSQDPVMLGRDGRLWFGTLKGAAIIDVRNLPRNMIPPPVIIDRMFVNGEEHPAVGTMTLAPGLNNLEFRFTAGSLVGSERNTFRYRLEGFDADWVSAGGRRVVYYTDVSPGSYRFYVEASNNDGMKSEHPAVIALVLEPQFYQTFWFYGILVAAVFGLGVVAQKVIWRYRNEKEWTDRLQTRLEASQLRVLRMQLHPHFLFNTLNAISSMILTKPRQAVAMVGKLSDMLRISLEKEQIQFTTLVEEIGFLNKYLSIEQVRFGGKLTVKLHIEKQTERALVPTFLLQPLAENAIKHGVGATGTKGEIEIKAFRSNGNLRIHIRDDGHGVPSKGPLREGVGLSNTRARLQQLYGDRYALVLSGTRDEGFCVEISLPLEYKALVREKHS